MSDTYKFDEQTKEVREFKERLPFGISDVTIEDIKTGKMEDSGKHYIAVSVKAVDGDAEEEVRLWLTSSVAANISFNALRDIAVHDAKTESTKESRRKAIDAITDSEELVTLIGKLKSPQAWVTKYYDKERTYTDNTGKTRRSVNTNLLGYKPKLKPELMPVQEMPTAEAAPDDSAPLTNDDLSDIPF